MASWVRKPEKQSRPKTSREDLRTLRERGSLSVEVGCSESVVVVSGTLVADFEFNFGALSEFFDCDLFGVFTLDLCQKMEIRIELLRIVLVGVCTELVVMSCCILPLLVRLNVEKFHE